MDNVHLSEEDLIWDKKLDAEIIVLQKCQTEKNVDDCMKCKEILGCQTRDNYVDFVYKTMHKDKGGDFEF